MTPFPRNPDDLSYDWAIGLKILIVPIMLAVSCVMVVLGVIKHYIEKEKKE
jgi:hypothetical protein